MRERLRTRANTWARAGNVAVWAHDRGLGHYGRCLLAAARERPQLLFVNSLFDPWMAILPAFVWRVFGSSDMCLAIAPRGQLARGALSKSALRKRAVLWFWRALSRSSRVVVHAATEREAEDVARVLGDVRVVVRPNDAGPLLPALTSPSPSGELRTVFVGRIVPIKGLLDLLGRLHQVECQMSLDIYGPEEDHHYAQECRAAAERLPKSVQVRFLGGIESDTVRSVVAQYDLMLNPTRGESFGQAIGESLSVGTPVVLAPVTPWTPWIVKSGGGAIVHEDAWAEAVNEISRRGRGDWRHLRQGARAAYENWWRDADSYRHVFDLILARLSCHDLGGRSD